LSEAGGQCGVDMLAGVSLLGRCAGAVGPQRVVS